MHYDDYFYLSDLTAYPSYPDNEASLSYRLPNAINEQQQQQQEVPPPYHPQSAKIVPSDRWGSFSFLESYGLQPTPSPHVQLLVKDTTEHKKDVNEKKFNPPRLLSNPYDTTTGDRSSFYHYSTFYQKKYLNHSATEKENLLSINSNNNNNNSIRTESSEAGYSVLAMDGLSDGWKKEKPIPTENKETQKLLRDAQRENPPPTQRNKKTEQGTLANDNSSNACRPPTPPSEFPSKPRRRKVSITDDLLPSSPS
ncbi:hypothetical protein ADEAN_000109000 [Angomonas deanei]|uniref:Uncharacterized protein n=1 Tax=Angomonas deanei TaxID=59799 RepID=A0A7G2C4I0_9TRYP|nr:hypothetical protein ADEAN_000109000 [Angomonas deanei]